MAKKLYGKELIMDLHHCDPSKFTKEGIKTFFVELCDLIKMERFGEPMYWHDDSEDPILKGCSGVQFIKTSNIVIHGCEMLQTAFVNIFSCKEFDTDVAVKFTTQYFKATEVNSHVVERLTKGEL